VQADQHLRFAHIPTLIVLLDVTIEDFRTLIAVIRITRCVMRALRIANLQTDGLARATTLVRNVCVIAGDRSLLDDLAARLTLSGIPEAVRRHDTDLIIDWFMHELSYQGVSDRVAEAYIEQHGSITAEDIRLGIEQETLCPKLHSYWHFADCGYRKTLNRCNQPMLMHACPLPRHDLRNGTLNQVAYSFYLFIRDVAGGDLVAWIDSQLEQVDTDNPRYRYERLRQAVVGPLRHVHGISDKLLNMSLASLLLGSDPDRSRWITAGAGMIAVDSLVHNWLHRTGILCRLQAEHRYGPACYQVNGCAALLQRIARRIDARQFNPKYPKVFPRFVQTAIWSFCAQSVLDQCNGNRIDDRSPCEQSDCSLFLQCDRVSLKPSAE
jgi:hypothetical protein